MPKHTQRPIKFRIYYTPKDYPHIKDMHYFDLFSFGSDDGSQWLYTEVNGRETMLDYWHLEEYPIMQFTGLTDKNNKEIYEGDIVKANHYWVNAVVEQNEVGTWSLVQGDGVCSDWSIEQWNEFEIIGNRFENPDLLSA